MSNLPGSESSTVDARRSPWFWLLTMFLPLVVGLAIFGAISLREKWTSAPLPKPPENPEIESAIYNHYPKESTRFLQGKIERTKARIEALELRLQALQAAIKKDEGGPLNSKGDKAYLQSLRKAELDDVALRLEDLRLDQQYYVHELRTLEVFDKKGAK